MGTFLASLSPLALIVAGMVSASGYIWYTSWALSRSLSSRSSLIVAAVIPIAGLVPLASVWTHLSPVMKPSIWYYQIGFTLVSAVVLFYALTRKGTDRS